MNKQILMVALLISGATTFGATLKEKLAANSEKIQTMKQKVRAGISIHAQAHCGPDCRGCGE